MLERQLGVAGGKVGQAALLAPARAAHLDARPAALAEERLQEVRVLERLRHHHLAGDRHLAAVVLQGEAPEHVRRGAVGGVLEVEAVPVGQAPVPQVEQLHVGGVAAARDAEHIGRAHAAAVGDLALRQVPHRHQPVAVPGRILELMLLGGLFHLGLEPPLERPHPARQELDHAVDDDAVLVPGDVADARGRAAADVVVEAGDARAAPGLGALAGAVGKHPVQHVERLAHLLRARIRPEVEHALAMPLTGEHDPRVLVADRDGDVGVGLVVAQADVERRPVALDQVLLEQQRLGLGVGGDELDLLDPLDQPGRLHGRVQVAAEVRPHPLAQRLGLADVEHLSLPAPEHVHPGLVGQGAELGVEALAALAAGDG